MQAIPSNDQQKLTNADYSFSERMQIIWRCVFNHCPKCNQPGISKPFHFPDQCPSCGFVYERGNGFLLSALPAVYFMYTLFWLLPFLILFIYKVLSLEVSMALIGIGAIAIPVLFFNYCKMLAIALYYFFLPRELYHHELQDKI